MKGNSNDTKLDLNLNQNLTNIIRINTIGLNKKILNDGNCHTNGRNGSWNFEEEKESETLSTETNVVYYKVRKE